MIDEAERLCNREYNEKALKVSETFRAGLGSWAPAPLAGALGMIRVRRCPTGLEAASGISRRRHIHPEWQHIRRQQLRDVVHHRDGAIIPRQVNREPRIKDRCAGGILDRRAGW